MRGASEKLIGSATSSDRGGNIKRFDGPRASLGSRPGPRHPPAAVRAEIPHRVPLQIVSASAQPPDGEGWLHEVKHDGHRLLAIVAGGDRKLISRNGHDRVHLFR